MGSGKSVVSQVILFLKECLLVFQDKIANCTVKVGWRGQIVNYGLCDDRDNPSLYDQFWIVLNELELVQRL